MNETAFAGRPAVAPRASGGETPTMSIRSLDFFYGKFHALKNVSLDVAERRVTAFIGPSGCGKSTLLRTFNRMYSLYPGQRATGEISFNGENVLDPGVDLNSCAPRCMVSRSHAVPHVDSTTISLWCAPLEPSDTARHGRAVESGSPRRRGGERPRTSEESGIARRAGQQQRWHRGARGGQAEVLLLDEPTSALDTIPPKDRGSYERKHDYTSHRDAHMQQAGGCPI